MQLEIFFPGILTNLHYRDMIIDTRVRDGSGLCWLGRVTRTGASDSISPDLGWWVLWNQGTQGADRQDVRMYVVAGLVQG